MADGHVTSNEFKRFCFNLKISLRNYIQRSKLRLYLTGVKFSSLAFSIMYW